MALVLLPGFQLGMVDHEEVKWGGAQEQETTPFACYGAWIENMKRMIEGSAKVKKHEGVYNNQE